MGTNSIRTWLASIALVAVSTATSAAPIAFDVFALNNSWSNGNGANGVATVSLAAGTSFTVTADPNDLWSAGALPRWSNANGLTGNRFATGSDESGQPAGTLIGQSFGTLTQAGLSAPFGALVGQIGSGSLFLIGTNFGGTAATSGVLTLFYWDTFFADNTQLVRATVDAQSTVPEPGSLTLILAALLGYGLLRARKRIAVRVRKSD